LFVGAALRCRMEGSGKLTSSVTSWGREGDRAAMPVSGGEMERRSSDFIWCATVTAGAWQRDNSTGKKGGGGGSSRKKTVKMVFVVYAFT
jgi:hypothetical protein